MDDQMPLLSADWIATVAAGDKHIENAATRLNEAVKAFGDEYSVECDAPGCSALDHLEAPSVEHVISHLAVAQALWGVRMKEHLFDLIVGLQGNRVLVVALLARAILETAAVVVHLEGRLGTLQAGAPEDGFRQLLDELHGTVGRGRYPWGDMGDAALVSGKSVGAAS